MAYIPKLAKSVDKDFNYSIHASINVTFELINVDLWGFFAVPSIIGAKFFVTIVNDNTKVTWTYMIKFKDQTYYVLCFFI